MNTGFNVAVIGGGFSGLAVVAQLQRRRPGVRVAWVRGDTPGFGLAYRTTDPGHLLNVRAERMSLWAQFGDDFVHWLQRHHPDRYIASDFVPRRVYANYLAAIESELPVSVQQFARMARTLSHQAQWRVELDDGTVLEACHCVLATGNPAMRSLSDTRSSGVVDDFWAWRLALDWVPPRLGDDDRVVIVGSGLSAVDAAVSLIGAGFAGQITAISSSGQLPQLHVLTAPVVAVDAFTAMRATPTALNYLISLRRLCRGRDWQSVVDGLRCQTTELWCALDSKQQQRFMRHLWNRWNQHRHRLAPAAHQRLQTPARFELRAGRVRSIKDGGVIWQRRGSSSEQFLPATLVINCTGPAYASKLLASSLMRGLIRDGFVQPHFSGLGIEKPRANHLHAIGPLLLGERLETTAVPELRQQADAIAALIARDLYADTQTHV